LRVLVLVAWLSVMTAKMSRISKRFSGGLSLTLYGVGGGTLLNRLESEKEGARDG